MGLVKFISISRDLDKSGLVWHPEIGDEVAERVDMERVSILVDPLGLTLNELRDSFLWLPTVEQLVQQIEARQALIYHAGINEKMGYEAVLKTHCGVIQASAATLRSAFGKALGQLLLRAESGLVH